MTTASTTTPLWQQFFDLWFQNQHWWFNASHDVDQLLCKKFQSLLDQVHIWVHSVCSKAISDSLVLQNSKFPLAIVIICDQLPRHIFRNTQSAHIIQHFLRMALFVCDVFTYHELWMDTLTPNEWCFMMLPYRHSLHFKHIKRVMSLAWNKWSLTSFIPFKQFIKATYQRCPTDDQSHSLQSFTQYDSHTFSHKHQIFQLFKDFLDPDSFIQLSDHLECKEFCKRYCQDYFQNLNDNFNDQPLILSLSGGVDSMLCSWLFKDRIAAAVHINYSNRASADREQDFVIAWCAYLRIPLFVRKINEIKRQPCMDADMREVYESYTRNVRFGTYKTVHHLFSSYKHNPTVLLGHNKDDCLENIFTNIAHSNHLQQLNGMDVVSSIDNIQFIRPLLHINKADIKHYARLLNIPFLPNSTPSWSQRGQIRNNIVPVLHKWHHNFIHGLHHLADHVHDLYWFFDAFVQQSLHNAEYSTHDIDDYMKCNLLFKTLHSQPIFWKTLLFKLTSIHIKDKSINNLIQRIQSFQKTTSSNSSNQSIVVLHKFVTLQLHKTSDYFEDFKVSIIYPVHNIHIL
jgi:tRNA(Ile)-lysidine synthetase-like protein